MKKIIFVAVFIVMIAGAFFFYNSQKSVIADDKEGNCTKTECNKTSECTKQNDKNCGNCTKQCDSKMEGQSLMNNKQNKDCRNNSDCVNKSGGINKSGGCPYKNQ